jgi:hypothetical protein
MLSIPNSGGIIVAEAAIGIVFGLEGVESFQAPGFVTIHGLHRLVAECVVGVSCRLATWLPFIPEVPGL